MSRAERAKGQRGQLAVRRLFESHGWTWVGTASSRRAGSSGTCDGLAIRDGVTLAVEVKNQAVLRLPLWRRQTLANAPAGTVPVLVYKRSHLWLADLCTGDMPYDATFFAQTYPAVPVAA